MRAVSATTLPAESRKTESTTAVESAAAFFFFFLKNGILGLAIIQMKANNKSAMKGYFLI